MACIKEEVSSFFSEGAGQKLLAVILAATCVHLSLHPLFVFRFPRFFYPLACRKLRARRPDTNTLRDNVMNFVVGGTTPGKREKYRKVGRDEMERRRTESA